MVREGDSAVLSLHTPNMLLLPQITSFQWFTVYTDDNGSRDNGDNGALLE
jgi:hypothetical protein